MCLISITNNNITLRETNSSHLKISWLEDEISFWGPGLSSGALGVSLRDIDHNRSSV